MEQNLLTIYLNLENFLCYLQTNNDDHPNHENEEEI